MANSVIKDSNFYKRRPTNCKNQSAARIQHLTSAKDSIYSLNDEPTTPEMLAHAHVQIHTHIYICVPIYIERSIVLEG